MLCIIHLLKLFCMLFSGVVPSQLFPTLEWKAMPSLLPLKQFSSNANMSSDEEMEVNPTVEAPAPIDLTVKSSNLDSRFCYRASSTDSLITNGSIEDNEGDYSDAEPQFHGYRPRLPTADMVLMLKKYKQREAPSRFSANNSSPLNLSTKGDNRCNNVPSSDEPYNSAKILRNELDSSSNFGAKTVADESNEIDSDNKFDWADYRRSSSCSQIDFRFHRRLAANRLQRKHSVNDGKCLDGSREDTSASELFYDHDDGFHDELDCTSTKASSNIRSSPVKKLLNNKGKNSSLKRQDSGFMIHGDTGRILMNEPPETFVHTLERLSFENTVQKPQHPPFLHSFTDQYLPHCVMPMDTTIPVDAFGYYAHLMQRIQMHKVERENGHSSTPNLSVSPTQTDEAGGSADANYIFNNAQGKKRPARTLTGRHVREGTGASPSTLVSLRKAIEERQRIKKTDLVDRKTYSKKKSVKGSAIRPRAYSASLSVRTVAEDNESDAISVASE